MGAGASWHSDRRYMAGMHPEEYWNQVAWPENEETMEILRFTKHQGLTIFNAFVMIDTDNSGEMSVEEFHQYLGMPQTKFSERVFGILDTDGSGALDFAEFVVGVWNYCTYDVRLITKLAFDIFDIDNVGKMDIYECDALLRMVYDVERIDEIQGPPSGREILAELDVNGDGEVTIDEFSDLVDTHGYILAPAFDLQRALRQRLLGINHWERETEARRVMFADYDTLDKSSWESVKEILAVKKKALEEKKAADEEAADLEVREEIEHDQDRSKEAWQERQARRKRKLQRLQNHELEEEREEKEAVAKLKEKRAVLEDVGSYSSDEDLRARVAARKELYEALEELRLAVTKSRDARGTKYKAQVVAQDAETKMREYLSTKEGKKRLKYDMQVQYGEEMFVACNEGNKLSAAVAPLFRAPVEDTATTAAKFTMAFSRHKTLAQHREKVLRKLLNEYKNMCQDEFDDKQAKEKAKHEKAFQKMYDDFVFDFGGPETKWERFVDPNSESMFWWNYETGETKWTKPAICHKCDHFIESVDVRCFTCNTDRSQNNLRLYNGISVDAIKKRLDGDGEGEGEEVGA